MSEWQQEDEPTMSTNEQGSASGELPGGGTASEGQGDSMSTELPGGHTVKTLDTPNKPKDDDD